MPLTEERVERFRRMIRMPTVSYTAHTYETDQLKAFAALLKKGARLRFRAPPCSTLTDTYRQAHKLCTYPYTFQRRVPTGAQQQGHCTRGRWLVPAVHMAR